MKVWRLVVWLEVLLLSGCTLQDPAVDAQTLHQDSSTNFRVLTQLQPDAENRALVQRCLQKIEPRDAHQITVGFSAFTLANPFFMEEVRYAAQCAEGYGMRFVYTDASDDMEKQSSSFDSLIAQGVDCIIADLRDPIGNVADIRRAVQAGIPVIAVDGGVNADAPIITLFSSDSYRTGMLVGQYAASHCNSNLLRIGVLSGRPGNAQGESRTFGMLTGVLHMRSSGQTESQIDHAANALMDALMKNGHAENAEYNVVLVAQGWGNWQEEGGLTATENLLYAYPDMDLLLCENDVMAFGAAQAIHAAGRTGKTLLAAAADGTRRALDMIRQGELLCTGYNNPRIQAKAAIDLIYDIFVRGEDASDLPLYLQNIPVTIHRENVDTFLPDDPHSGFARDIPILYRRYMHGREEHGS